MNSCEHYTVIGNLSVSAPKQLEHENDRRHLRPAGEVDSSSQCDVDRRPSPLTV